MIEVRDPGLTFEDARRLVLLARLGEDESASTCAAALSILNREESEGADHPPGHVALMDAARGETP